MKIQEMRSGILHLNKKMENERPRGNYETSDFGGWETNAEPLVPTADACELDEAIWSVISFDKCEAGGLLFRQATELMLELDAHGVSGLCIVTDAAAQRLRG